MMLCVNPSFLFVTMTMLFVHPPFPFVTVMMVLLCVDLMWMMGNSSYRTPPINMERVSIVGKKLSILQQIKVSVTSKQRQLNTYKAGHGQHQIQSASVSQQNAALSGAQGSSELDTYGTQHVFNISNNYYKTSLSTAHLRSCMAKSSSGESDVT